MAKIGYTTKESVTDNQLPDENKFSDADANEIKSSVNDLYDAVGAGAESDNLIIYSINTVGDLASVVAAITDAASDNIYTIEVRPGNFTTEPIILKPYIYIIGVDKAACRINADAVGDTIFSLVPSSGISSLTIAGATSGIGVDYTTTSGFSFSNNVTIINCATGVQFDGGVGGAMNADDVSFDGTFTTGFDHNGGNLILRQPVVSGISTLNTFISSDSSDSILTLDRPLTFSFNVTTALSFTDGARVSANDGNIIGPTDGMVISGDDTNVITSGFKIFNCTNDGVRVDNTGTDPTIIIQSGVIDGSGNYDINILNATTSLTGSGQTSIDKLNFVPGVGVYGTIIDLKEGDEGFNVLGELHVGLPERGAESVLGEGDSYTRGMLVYTETPGNSFVDVSAAAASTSLSTFTFTGTATDNSIYIASSLANTDALEHYGIKTIVNTTAVNGAGVIILEYWNGAAWVDLNGMEVDSGGSYYPYAKNYFKNTGAHHLRYDSTLVSDSWTKNDPMTLGTDYYWVRFRISSTITTAPVFEQFKLHTNRFEINSDGWVEYFGKSRPIAKLPWEVQVFEKATGTDVKDQDLYLSQTIDNGGKKNKFLYNETDPNKVQRIGFKTTLPFDMDTSSPVDFQWSIVSDVTDVGTIDWIIRWGFNSDGDSVYTTSGAAPATSPNQQEISYASTPPSTLDKTKWYKTSLDVSDMISRRDAGFGDTIWVSMERSSTDTHTGDASLIAMGAYYTKWCEGGHA